MLRRVTIAAALLLCGCWEGTALYSPSDAVPALEPGRYELVELDGERLSLRISAAPDGLTRVNAEGDEESFGFAPLDRDGRSFVMWSRQSGENGSRGALFYYHLLQRRGPNEYLIYRPSCDGREAEIALASGAARQAHPYVSVCRFGNRETLEAAMRRVIPARERTMRLVRLRDG